MQIINRINIALGRGADERQISAITRIVIHHSGNPTNGTHLNTALFENTWRYSSAMGAPNARGGYHEVVLFNGNVEINMQDRRRTWGAAGQNDHTWHICLTGQHAYGINNITQTQLNSLAVRIAAAMRRFGWTAANVDRIIRHRDLPGQSTACTEVNVTNVRNAVRSLLSQTAPAITNPANNAVIPRQAFNITWGLVSGASYLVSLRNLTTDALLINRRAVGVGSNSSRVEQSQLVAGHRYRVAVASVVSGQEQWAERLFSVIPNPPTITNPANNANIPRQAFNITWGLTTGATSYLVSMRNVTTNALLINRRAVGANTNFLRVEQNQLVVGHRYRIAVASVAGGHEQWIERYFNVR